MDAPKFHGETSRLSSKRPMRNIHLPTLLVRGKLS
jgi:hypothetical protein